MSVSQELDRPRASCYHTTAEILFCDSFRRVLRADSPPDAGSRWDLQCKRGTLARLQVHPRALTYSL